MTQQYEFNRAMVVTAHPDDAEFGCSGTVARWCREGKEVVYILCTDGSKGSSDPDMTSERLAVIRQKEQTAAGKILGLKEVVFLGYPDAYFQPTLEVRRDIAREIRRYKPEVLICQYPARAMVGDRYGGHPDHMAAGEAALAAVFPTARDRLTFPELLEQGLEPHHVREVLVMGHPEPDKWIDVSQDMDTAIKALRQHKSQLRRRNPGKRMLQGRHRTGEPHGMQYAEAFKRFLFN